MSDQDQPTKAIIPVAANALTTPRAARAVLPIAGTAALAWAGRKVIAVARDALKKRRGVSRIQPVEQERPLIYIRYTRVTITVNQQHNANDE